LNFASGAKECPDTAETVAYAQQLFHDTQILTSVVIDRESRAEAAI
jgi:hypothetical protein